MFTPTGSIRSKAMIGSLQPLSVWFRPTTVTTPSVLFARSFAATVESGRRIPVPQLYHIPFEDRLTYINSKQKLHRRPIHLSALFSGATTSEELRQAFDVFKSMRENLIPFDPDFYTDVVKACVKLKETDPILELLDLPPNARIYPSSSSVVRLLRHFYATKDLEATKRLHDTLLQRHPDELSQDYYYEHVHWCRKEGLLDEALAYWEEFCGSKLKEGRNIRYEASKAMAEKGAWNSILSLDNPRNKASIVRMKVIASLKLGDQEGARRLLIENASLSPLSVREEYVRYCTDDTKPALISVLNQLVEKNNDLFGDSAELLLLQLQEE
eukprot:TRINITY_DN15430_c0_g1_i1.p1 TRINITY_DN15430_c0_g1~~TRINITY_DN15430_c0_g1_i1.p1  ORF type:complete len:365 (-),score=75.82 TRINITY_DN15430_c0_g1_i1:46-1026(-)